MSFPQYANGAYVASWDFECPACGDMWNNEGDPIGEGQQVEEECPGCKKVLLVTASYSVDYDIEIKEPAPEPAS